MLRRHVFQTHDSAFIAPFQKHASKGRRSSTDV